MTFLIHEVDYWTRDDHLVTFRTGNSAETVVETLSLSRKKDFAKLDTELNLRLLESGSKFGVYVFFPQPIELDGVWAYVTATYPRVQYSTDATTPSNGTWSNFGTPGSNYSPSQMLTNGPAVVGSASNVKAIRIYQDNFNVYWHHMRIWGRPSAANFDGVQLWHPTLDQILPEDSLDFGTVGLGGTSTVDFRVKNMSDSSTANDVTISVPSDNDLDELAAGVDFDTGGGYSAGPVNIGSLAAGAISGVITARATIGAGEALGVDGATMRIDVGSFS